MRPGPLYTPAPTLPPLFRTLAALLIVDGLLGLWLALHTRDGIALFLTPQLPILGVGGLFWGFLPEESKKQFGAWLEAQLARRTLLWGILALGVSGMLVSLFVSTVVLHSVDPSATELVKLVRGSRERPDTQQLRKAHVIRLNKLTSPQYHHAMTLPFGRQLWLYTRTHVSTNDWTLRPWFPLVFQYPDDFEPMVTVAVLPADSILPRLSQRNIVFRLADAVTGEPLAADTLERRSLLIAFGQALAIDEEVQTRWRDSLKTVKPDTGFVNPMMRRWVTSTKTAAARPLRIGETIQWEVADRSGRVLRRDTLRLNYALQDLHLAF
jgi:hypothetical protein